MIAALPDAVASAAAPPSKAAIRFSNTSEVGFMSLVYIFPPSVNPNLPAAWAESANT